MVADVCSIDGGWVGHNGRGERHWSPVDLGKLWVVARLSEEPGGGEEPPPVGAQDNEDAVGEAKNAWRPRLGVVAGAGWGSWRQTRRMGWIQRRPRSRSGGWRWAAPLPLAATQAKLRKSGGGVWACGAAAPNSVCCRV
jgi:hypothetical protein